MDDFSIQCVMGSSDCLDVSSFDDTVFLSGDVALDAEKVAQLRDALTEWLEGQA